MPGLFYKKSSTRYTAAQDARATVKRLPENHATITATAKATIPEIELLVAVMIAGNAMTASVTYGT